MNERIEIYPYTGLPEGTDVYFRRQGSNQVEMRHFPPGTSDRDIQNAIRGVSAARIDAEEIRRAEENAKREKRARESQPPKMESEDEKTKERKKKEKETMTLEAMRIALNESGVHGASLMKAHDVRQKYDELCKKGMARR